MIYLDQWGVCRSTSPKDVNYSMDRMVKEFEEVRTALGYDQWITMGHSFGRIYRITDTFQYNILSPADQISEAAIHHSRYEL